MEVIANQHLWLENAISYKSRVETNRLLQLIQHIKTNMDALDLKITDDLIFSVTETVSENDNTILGVEFIIPVDKPVTSNCHFVFKPKFRMENAVLTKYCGKISELASVKKALYEYALNNNKTILTDVYYEVKQLDGDNAVLNAYMGVSGNSL